MHFGREIVTCNFPIILHLQICSFCFWSVQTILITSWHSFTGVHYGMGHHWQPGDKGLPVALILLSTFRSIANFLPNMFVVQQAHKRWKRSSGLGSLRPNCKQWNLYLFHQFDGVFVVGVFGEHIDNASDETRSHRSVSYRRVSWTFRHSVNSTPRVCKTLTEIHNKNSLTNLDFFLNA